MKDYQQIQDSLHDQAENILAELDLINLLNKFGKPVFVGSYALGLMSCPDIDIVVNSKINVDNYLEIVNSLFKKQNVYSMSVQDFRKSVFPNRPQGLYCGIKYLIKPNLFWKIDIWFLADKTSIDLTNSIKEKLNDKNKQIILKIKNEMRQKIKNGKEISGMEVYKSVLDKGVTNLKEFKKYIKNKEQ